MIAITNLKNGFKHNLISYLFFVMALYIYFIILIKSSVIRKQTGSI